MPLLRLKWAQHTGTLLNLIQSKPSSRFPHSRIGLKSSQTSKLKKSKRSFSKSLEWLYLWSSKMISKSILEGRKKKTISSWSTNIRSVPVLKPLLWTMRGSISWSWRASFWKWASPPSIKLTMEKKQSKKLSKIIRRHAKITSHSSMSSLTLTCQSWMDSSLASQSKSFRRTPKQVAIWSLSSSLETGSSKARREPLIRIYLNLFKLTTWRESWGSFPLDLHKEYINSLNILIIHIHS